MLKAARQAIDEVPELGAALDLSFVGILQEEYTKLVTKLGLDRNVTIHGYLPHQESVAELLASDVLWMTMSDDLSAPGKLYEYFGTRKTVLGLVPQNSHAQRLLREYGNAITVPPDDVTATKETIIDLYRKWKEWDLQQIANEEFVNRHDRQAITQDLAKQLTFISGTIDSEIKRLRTTVA
jgi:glycosyltransferase involved in cell wall biosynthesis